MNDSSRSRLIDFTKIEPRAPVMHRPAPMLQTGRSLLPRAQSFTATLIVVFIVGTTALSLYDLYLFLKLVAR